MSVDYRAVLADLEAKKKAIENMIASTRALMGLDAFAPGDGPSEVSSTNRHSGPMELPVGALMGKSLPDAVRLYMSSVPRKQSIKEIATALRDGGVESTSDNFENVITGALHRLKKAGTVLRFKDGWGLAENYSEHIRRSVSQAASKPKPKIARKAAKKPPSARPEGPPLEHRIETLFATEAAGEVLTVEDISSRVSWPKQGVAVMLGKMAKSGKVVKGADGFRAARKNIQEMPKAV